MRRDPVDLFVVLPQHFQIHERLANWARYVRDTGRHGACAPMFRLYRPERDNGYAVEPRSLVDTIDGHKVEKAVSQLPEKHRDAIRWHYVYVWIQPGKVQRHLAVTRDGLVNLIHDGRSMLNNRAVTK